MPFAACLADVGHFAEGLPAKLLLVVEIAGVGSVKEGRHRLESRGSVPGFWRGGAMNLAGNGRCVLVTEFPHRA